MIDLNLQEQSIIKIIIKQTFADEFIASEPSIQVYIFGSRATNKARKFSDVDLAIKAKSKISMGKIAQLKADFSASDLPFMVDIIDLNAISDEFYQAIKPEKLKLI